MDEEDYENYLEDEEIYSSTGNEGIEKEEDSIVENSVTDVTDVTNENSVTDVTDVTNGCVTTPMCDTSFLNALFDDSTLSEILVLLYSENRGFTYDELADVIGKKEETIRQTINRNIVNFDIKKPNGRVCVTHLSHIANEMIEEKIRIYNKIFEQKKHQEKKVLLEINLIKSFFNNYKKEIGKSIRKDSNVININFMDIAQFSGELADNLISSPEETINLLEKALDESGLIKCARVRISNLPEVLKFNIEQLRENHLNSFISLKGRVISLSDIRPQAVSATFECPSCGTIISVLQKDKKFSEPKRCSCGRRGGFNLISKEMISTARLILEDLQEKTDNPHTKRLNCFLKEGLLSEENVKLYLPGNEIELCGILKEVPVDLKKGGISTRFEIALEVNSVSKSNEEITIEKLTEEDITNIKELASKIDSNGLDEITESFAPEIYGYNYIKRAITLQLSSKKNEVGKEHKKNKPNILLIGEPGVAKTVLGEFAVDITNGARKSVGGSASAIGFTGAVVRDEYSGGWSLEPGAFVLARDFFLLDELNNIKEEDRPRLQEALSENTITIDKATIHTKLSAPAAVLATANPINGIFNDNEDITKQFSLTAPIINRFDLIFVVRDIVNEENDEKIAKKMNGRERKTISCKYSKDFLRKFFIYIKEQNNPIIDDAIDEKISKIYSKLRKYKTHSLNINPRVHSALLQLCKASAKIRLSENVEEKDIELALDILNKSYFKTPLYKEIIKEF